MDETGASDVVDGSETKEDPYASAVEAVKTLAQVMSRNGVTELDLSFGDVSIRLRSGTAAPAPAVTGQATAPSPVSVPETPADEGYVITAPMIGTFYTAPAPGEDPFVQVGDVVSVGQTIGIIEAMKIMNEITADKGGIVVEIIAQNAQAVEYGSPLIRLAASGAA